MVIMNEIRSRVRAIIFGITGIIVAFLIFRIGLDLIGASTTNAFVKIIFDISNYFITPFIGLIEVQVSGIPSRLNFDAILALGVYVTFAIIFAEIVTAFLYDNVEDILQNIVDGIFKFLEFILFLRIIFELFALTSRAVLPQFVNTIYSLTNWTRGILFDIKIGEGFLDLSAVIVLIIIVTLDITTENLIRNFFEQRRKIIKIRETKRTERSIAELTQPQQVVVNQPTPQPIIVQPQQQVQQPIPQQNITINLPMPPVQSQQQRQPLPQFVEYSDKTARPADIKVNVLDAEDLDPKVVETKTVIKKKGIFDGFKNR